MWRDFSHAREDEWKAYQDSVTVATVKKSRLKAREKSEAKLPAASVDTADADQHVDLASLEARVEELTSIAAENAQLKQGVASLEAQLHELESTPSNSPAAGSHHMQADLKTLGLDATDFKFGRRVFRCMISHPGVAYRKPPSFHEEVPDTTSPEAPYCITADAMIQGPKAVFVRCVSGLGWLPLTDPHHAQVCFKHLGEEQEVLGASEVGEKPGGALRNKRRGSLQLYSSKEPGVRVQSPKMLSVDCEAEAATQPDEAKHLELLVDGVRNLAERAGGMCWAKLTHRGVKYRTKDMDTTGSGQCVWDANFEIPLDGDESADDLCIEVHKHKSMVGNKLVGKGYLKNKEKVGNGKVGFYMQVYNDELSQAVITGEILLWYGEKYSDKYYQNIIASLKLPPVNAEFVDAVEMSESLATLQQRTFFATMVGDEESLEDAQVAHEGLVQPPIEFGVDTQVKAPETPFEGLTPRSACNERRAGWLESKVGSSEMASIDEMDADNDDEDDEEEDFVLERAETGDLFDELSLDHDITKDAFESWVAAARKLFIEICTGATTSTPTRRRLKRVITRAEFDSWVYDNPKRAEAILPDGTVGPGATKNILKLACIKFRIESGTDDSGGINVDQFSIAFIKAIVKGGGTWVATPSCTPKGSPTAIDLADRPKRSSSGCGCGRSKDE